MSLYNLIHGTNAMAPVLLAILGVAPDNVPRFRDCWWDGKHIAIHTRTGGGNRDYYECEERCRDNYPDYFAGDDAPKGPWNKDLRALPTFVYDEDDDYDCSYATFYFTVPNALAWVIPQLSAQDSSPRERWQGVIDKLSQPGNDSDHQVKKAVAAFAPIFEQIKKHIDSELSEAAGAQDLAQAKGTE